MGDIVVYEDSNNNNTTVFRVTSNVGPCKYHLEVTIGPGQ